MAANSGVFNAEAVVVVKKRKEESPLYTSLIERNHPSLSSISTKFVNFHQLKKSKRLELVDKLINTPKKNPS